MPARTTLALVLVATAATAATPARAADRLWAVDNNGDLRSLSADAPAGAGPAVKIHGLAPGESVRGIDVRPATGELYALGSEARVYRVDERTGVATPVSDSPFSTGSPFLDGFDFNPVADRIRVIRNDNEANMRVNPDTGALAATDTPLTVAGQSVVGVAYDRSVPGATATTLFGIAITGADHLVRIGGVDGVPSPNGGVLTTIGPLGTDSALTYSGFDIAPGGTAYAALNIAGGPTLMRVDLTTGAATTVGVLPGATVNGLAVQPTGRVRLESPSYSVAEDAGPARIAVVRDAPADTSFVVDYALTAGTASAADFTPSSGRLTFAAGETTKTIDVPITNDAEREDPEAFTVTLSDPALAPPTVVSTAPLGTPAVAGVVIADDDRPPAAPKDVTGPVILALDVRAKTAAKIRVAFACSEACHGAARLQRGTRRVTSKTVALSRAGRGSVTFSLTRAQRKSLAGKRLTARFDLADAAGNHTRASAAVTLRR